MELRCCSLQHKFAFVALVSVSAELLCVIDCLVFGEALKG